jgi:hypothetical protein
MERGGGEYENITERKATVNVFRFPLNAHSPELCLLLYTALCQFQVIAEEFRVAGAYVP